MLFSSLTFLFGFLPILGISYFIIPKKNIKIKNVILLIFSLIFYAWGEPTSIIIMLITILESYIFGIVIDSCEKKNKKKMKLVAFIISILLIVGNLIYYKYTNFFIENVNNIFSMNITNKNIILPIGISFYTFQILSYVIDLYRKKIQVQKNYFNLALYISFFPQLIAGPIVKYETIEEQLNKRTENLNKIVEGAERFILGLGKKVIIANNMAIIADAVFNSSILNTYSGAILVIGTLAYTFQIYYDFSGYSDMAIGLGKIFGFDFLENFDYPYMAKSINDFWKRWHISLTTFFREYVYFPLGGNRVSKPRWIINLLIVWILTGFWHGAAWNFIIWGLYYYILLLLEKTILKKFIVKIPNGIRYILTFCLVNIGWIIFRVNNLSDLFIILKNMTNIKATGLIEFLNNNPSIITAIPYMLLAIIFSINIFKRMEEKLKDKRIYDLIKKVFIIIIFICCIMKLTSSLYNPFIYFRF